MQIQVPKDFIKCRLQDLSRLVEWRKNAKLPRQQQLDKDMIKITDMLISYLKNIYPQICNTDLNDSTRDFMIKKLQENTLQQMEVHITKDIYMYTRTHFNSNIIFNITQYLNDMLNLINKTHHLYKYGNREFTQYKKTIIDRITKLYYQNLCLTKELNHTNTQQMEKINQAYNFQLTEIVNENKKLKDENRILKESIKSLTDMIESKSNKRS